MEEKHSFNSEYVSCGFFLIGDIYEAEELFHLFLYFKSFHWDE